MRILFLLLLVAVATAQEPSRATAPEITLDQAKLQQMESAIKAGEFKKIGSVLVTHSGKLVYEGYFEGDANTLRDTRSATKSITSILVGLAIQEKKLNGVDARIFTLLPERKREMKNPDPRKERITIEDFLTMSSPLECNDWEDFSQGNEERMYLVEDWTRFILDLPIAGSMHAGEKVEPPKYGRRFSYCTGGVFVLSDVITKATGLRTDHFAQQKLFAPLGIKPENVMWVYSPLNVPQTGGGLRLTSRDLLKIAQLYLDDGKVNGKQIIDPLWVKASTTPHTQIDEKTDYGYLWWLQTFQSGDHSYPAIYMTGNGGNKVLVFPSLDMTVVITSTNYNTRGMHEQTEKILTDYVLASIRRTH
jgi:CubicO group peptidase (beta-lactamase class C family)